MTPDPERQRLRDALWQNGTSLTEASLAIGKNKAYLQQYLSRGMPKVLSFQDSARLGELLGRDPDEFRHAEQPPRKPWTRKRRQDARPALVRIPVVEVEASAGPGALADEFVVEKASWTLPVDMIRHEGHARPEDMRILMVRGDSMEPEMREGDRLLVDTGRRSPGTGEMCVLWDGNGLVVKRIEPVHGDGPPRLRLRSANPAYEPYTCLAEEVHVVGKVVWTLNRH